MVYVRLARKWTDGGGVAHAAGDLIDVDVVTLAKLEADGVVAATGSGEGAMRPEWAGSTVADPGSSGPKSPAPPVPAPPAPKQPPSGSPRPGPSPQPGPPPQPGPEWAGST